MIGRPKIVLLGMLTKMPVGGVAWLMGQYIIGFERLGFEVYYVEAHARTPSMFVHDDADDGTDAAAAYLAGVMDRFGLGDRWAFHALHADGRCVGMSASQLATLYREATLILNMHGGTVPLPEHAAAGRLVLLSTDPVELELEIERGHAPALAFLEPHVAAFTWALNYGNPDCRLPWSSDHVFVPSPPPVVLDLWANDGPPPNAPFTTIGNWRQDWREVRFQGERYAWSKHHEFAKVVDLPSRVTPALELALSSASDADREMLRANGWRVENGLAVSAELDDYRSYVLRSAGEFTVAKDQNVRFRTGWFSERSACYLAAGRPVVMQDTGFLGVLHGGTGLLAFHDVDTAAAAVEAVWANPERHRRAARELAEEQLSDAVVLLAMLDHLGIAIPSRPSPRGSRTDVQPLPDELVLVPLSRRPLVLPDDTVAMVSARPIPCSGTQVDRVATSIVMVVLDNLVLTRMAVETVLAHSGEDFELIVVDNGSGEATQHYLRVLASRYGRVRLIRNERNLGFAPAVNQGLQAATGDVLVLLNNDVIVPPDWLGPLVDRLRDRTIGLVGPATNRCGNEAEISTRYTTYAELRQFVAARRRRALEGDAPADFDIPVATMFCVAMRRDSYAAVGGLDERFEVALFEDDDYARRVRAARLRVVCAPSAFVHHFGEGSLGHLAAEGLYGEVFASNRHRFETKWGDTWQPHARRPDPAYTALVARVAALIDAHVPAGARALVVSRGDEQLVPADQDRLRHFPCTPDGTYSGHYPRDDQAAVADIESHRISGTEYLVLPATGFWWLDHYRGLARYLESRPPIVNEPGTAVIFHLAADNAPVDSRAEEAESAQISERDGRTLIELLARLSSRMDRIEDALDELASPAAMADDIASRCRSAVRTYVPRGARVAAAGFDASQAPPARAIVPLAVEWPEASAGSSDGGEEEGIAAVASLEAQRARGCEFLIAAGDAVDRFASSPCLVDHVAGHYNELVRERDMWLVDLRVRRPRSCALSALVNRLETVIAEDPAILDWSSRRVAEALPDRNVFSGAGGASLAFLDRTIPIVVIDDPARDVEARRVASLAVVTLVPGHTTLVDTVDIVDDRVAAQFDAANPPSMVVLGSATPAWIDRLAEAVGVDQRIDTGSDPRWPEPDTDVLVFEEPIIPLPGCVDAMRVAARATGAGAVAAKLLNPNGSIAAAGATVFADKTWMGTLAGSTTISAPWHDYVRSTAAATGVLFVTADALAIVRAHRSTPPADALEWSAALWASGSKVVYQPEAVAVRVQPAPDPRPTPLPKQIGERVGRAPAPPPEGVGNDEFWRALIAGGEVDGCWKPGLELVR